MILWWMTHTNGNGHDKSAAQKQNGKEKSDTGKRLDKVEERVNDVEDRLDGIDKKKEDQGSG